MLATHLFSDDQTGRWIGPVLFQPERNFGISFCGQTFYLGDERTCRNITNDVQQATCKRCLNSYGTKIIGLGVKPTTGRKNRSPQVNLIDAITQRIASGIPMNEHDRAAVQMIAGILGMESPL